MLNRLSPSVSLSRSLSASELSRTPVGDLAHHQTLTLNTTVYFPPTTTTSTQHYLSRFRELLVRHHHSEELPELKQGERAAVESDIDEVKDEESAVVHTSEEAQRQEEQQEEEQEQPRKKRRKNKKAKKAKKSKKKN
eukprot:TRINITY_DN66434_c4_g1_i1.p2 TRINITY_DN66434_c4_g1~~TRINITY_DN66434_c4_g1_i1.p2  ORF type:complete len:150 (+),score=73.75 TRINITY_DN66434_c4_g1_i1:40-450(+)